MLDSFPLIHLADLSFSLNAATLKEVATSALLLSFFTPSFNPSLSQPILREFRRRREAMRARLGNLQGIEIYAGERRENDRWSGIEGISYDFDVTEGVLELSSAQLLVSRLGSSRAMEIDDIFRF